MATKRYITKADGNNVCTVKFMAGHRAGETRTYWAQRIGGYVYDVTDRPGTSGAQVIDMRHSDRRGGGSTLVWSGTATLADLMRDQVRRMLDAEAA